MPYAFRPRIIYHQRAYSLIEIMIVIAMIMVLLSLALVAYGRARRNAKVTMARATINNTKKTILVYAETAEKIPKLPDNLDSRGIWLWMVEEEILDSVPIDPWNKVLEIEFNGKFPEIYSLGPDGRPSDDDVRDR